MPEERELEGLKREMEKLADCLNDMGDDLDSAAVGDMLKSLINGATAETIIEDFGLEAGI